MRGVLERERKKTWEQEGNQGSCSPLVFKGCEDHIVHLASTEFERRLVERAQIWGMKEMVKGKRHVSGTAVCHIIARIKSDRFNRAFKFYLSSQNIPEAFFPRYSETRYASVCIISLKYLEYEKEILLFSFESFGLFSPKKTFVL